MVYGMSGSLLRDDLSERMKAKARRFVWRITSISLLCNSKLWIGLLKLRECLIYLSKKTRFYAVENREA